ncbi:MAG TPA: TonB-dependent receptor, partial [Steroidobacter sp.]|nr:TonB-dependent receptor [Steroidobacter sp.]
MGITRWDRAMGMVLGATALQPAYSAEMPLPTIEIQEIVVTGSRLKVPDREYAAHVVILDRVKIDELGVASVAELIRYVPQMPYAFADGFQFGGAQFAEMRGLGVDTTLVLINGRRTVPTAINVAVNAFDLNTIPLAAVERVEILSDSASAVYGADAVGGVINVVLKREIDRPVVEASYGTANGGGEEQRASLSSGYAGERAHASFVLDYFDRDFLLGEARARWADQDFRRFGGFDWRSSATHPGNISSRTGGNLPGLPSPFAAVPEGSSGVGLTPSDFLATAGVRRMASPFAWRSVVTQAERRSAAGLLEYDWTPSLTTFAELLYAQRTSVSQSEPATLTNARVPASNPFNPFGVDVSASYAFEGIGPRHTVAEQTLERALGGARGALGAWEWEAAGLFTQEDSSSWTDNAVNVALANAALASTDPATALNVFQDGPGGSQALLQSLLMRPLTRVSSDGEQLSAFVRGPLFSMAAGEVQVVVGGERRKEAVDFDGAVQLDHTRTVEAGFAEVRVPLVGGEFRWPAVHELSLTLAGRQDHYSDFGGTFNPQYAVRWAPHKDLLLSASYGTSFRAPAIFELFSPRREIVGNVVIDPRRLGE